MEFVYFYSHWSDQKDITKDFYNPILFSISTLRRFSNNKIIVLDYSDTNWIGYDEILNFNIIKKNPYMFGNDFSNFQNNVFSRNLHIFDICKKECDEKIFVSVDSDIFWLDCIKEINLNKFNILCEENKFNNGCFYFCKNKNGYKFMKKYVNNIKKIKFNKFRDEIKSRYFLLNDESICNFTYEANKHLCQKSDFIYNGALIDIDLRTWNCKNKNIHLLHSWAKKKLIKMNQRKMCSFCGLIPLLIKEVNEILTYQNLIIFENFNFDKIKILSINDLLDKNSTFDLFKEFVKFCNLNFTKILKNENNLSNRHILFQ